MSRAMCFALQPKRFVLVVDDSPVFATFFSLAHDRAHSLLQALAILKDVEKTSRDKKEELSSLLSPISDQEYRELADVSEAIQDFVPSALGGNISSSKDGGVAVVFEGEESSEGSRSDVEEEVQEVSDEDDEQPVGPSIEQRGGAIQEADQNRLLISPHSIDAYWLQRQVALTSADANEAQSLAEEALSILANAEEGARENELVALLGFGRFDLVKALIKNRAAVYFCTRLQRAPDSAARAALEEEMMQDEVWHSFFI